jgi:hypothetical protein
MKHKRLVFLLAAVTLLMSGVGLWAGEITLDLNAADPHPGANGTLTLSENQIIVEAQGLEPNAVYTVWFMRAGFLGLAPQEAGAGEAPYMFVTDDEGYGRYESSLAETPFGTWDMVMVVLHPDDDPENMDNIVEALAAEVPEDTAGA